MAEDAHSLSSTDAEKASHQVPQQQVKDTPTADHLEHYTDNSRGGFSSSLAAVQEAHGFKAEAGRLVVSLRSSYFGRFSLVGPEVRSGEEFPGHRTIGRLSIRGSSGSACVCSESSVETELFFFRSLRSTPRKPASSMARRSRAG